ncbi:MAG: 2-hydroxyacyl-CoA dehydratase family protein [Bacteroidota bacterium]|nr:2-hydroxyacyl-CoA dehydratase family protein [Bacteroidota bacterium]MDP4233221.1 2-hydroxyacyl-CoA dehydratase family protein [Bacteroidota bacterium]MDP4242160.1 2-hydroxyacyl-CoA dehydratase family protein [Bacteroidota bacterium]MDP4287810.1 2-hydroxyacyl-CoA dehydratase family protein [Bacteroidota bacterium]
MATQELHSTQLLKETMRKYFARLGECEQTGKKVAWCTSTGPAELLRAFGFEVYFPENHGALLGATRQASDFIPVAVKQGYAADICSYLTSDIGAFLEGKTPLTQHYGLSHVPRPDVLAVTTNQCREVQDWFSFYARHFNVPLVTVNPPRFVDEVTSEHVADVRRQFESLIPILEQVSGVHFDIDRFRETVRLSKEASVLWRLVLETAKTSPAPLNFFDGCIHMGPIVVLRGTEYAVSYYEALLVEVMGRVGTGVGVAPNEICRIYWDGMPIWGKLRAISNLFHSNNSVVVASTYCNSWILDTMDETNPFESTALAYTQIFINRSEQAKEKMLAELMEEYRVDGIIYHDARTCFNNTNSRFGMPPRLQAVTGVPSLVIEGDLCDLRFFSEGQSITKIEAFLEQLVDAKLGVEA